MAIIKTDPNGAWAKSPKWVRRLFVAAFAFLGLVVLLITIAPDPEPAVGEPVAVAAAPSGHDARAEHRRKGFHCLSSWDGSNRSLVAQIKEQLRNPDSFKHGSTEIGPRLANGMRPLKMVYRAENGFGGMNVNDDTCEATVISSVDQMQTLLPSPAG